MSELFNVDNLDAILVDFDGVLVDTQTEVDKRFRMFNCIISPEWNKYLANMDWDELLEQANIIGNGFEVLNKLVEQGKNPYIYTRTFSESESKSKIKFAKSQGFPENKFIICPGRIPKDKLIIPRKNIVLVEDSIENAMGWKNKSGIEILFRPDKSYVDQMMKLKNGITEYDEQSIEAFVRTNSLDRLTRKEELKEFRKYLIALGEVRRLNQISSMQDMTYKPEEINYTNDLSVLTRIR